MARMGSRIPPMVVAGRRRSTSMTPVWRYWARVTAELVGGEADEGNRDANRNAIRKVGGFAFYRTEARSRPMRAQASSPISKELGRGET